MKRIFLLFALLLGLASLASAAEVVIPIATEDMETITYQERDLDAFLLDIPADLAAKRLLGATLELRMGAVAGSTEARTEVQVAEWINGEPVVPAGKFRPHSLSIMGTSGQTVHMDITSLLEPVFATGSGEEVRLVLGRVSEWIEDMNDSALEPVDVVSDIQFRVYLQLL